MNILNSEIPKIYYKNTTTTRKLPEILTIEEVDRIIRIVDKDSNKGVRDNALLELMYATGMKVSEIINSNITVDCTKCRYCVDACPEEIDIAKIFDLYNKENIQY